MSDVIELNKHRIIVQEIAPVVDVPKEATSMASVILDHGSISQRVNMDKFNEIFQTGLNQRREMKGKVKPNLNQSTHNNRQWGAIGVSMRGINENPTEEELEKAHREDDGYWGQED